MGKETRCPTCAESGRPGYVWVDPMGNAKAGGGPLRICECWLEFCPACDGTGRTDDPEAHRRGG